MKTTVRPTHAVLASGEGTGVGSLSAAARIASVVSCCGFALFTRATWVEVKRCATSECVKMY